MAIKNGFYTAEELPIDVYHSDRGSISQSGLKRLGDQSPAHLRASLDGLTNDSPTAGQFIGSAIHAAALEPDVFDEQYIVAPDEFKRKNQAGLKHWKEEQDPRKIILMAYENEKVLRMREALYSNDWLADRLKGATCEYSCFADDPETGVTCRVRFDMVDSSGLVIDLKKTQDCKDAAIAKAISNYGYYVQNAFYIDVPTWLGEQYEPTGFAFVFVEEEAPHPVAIRFLEAEDIERGRQKYRQMLNTYAQCLKNNHWPSYSGEPKMIAMPGWARRDIDSSLFIEE